MYMRVFLILAASFWELIQRSRFYRASVPPLINDLQDLSAYLHRDGGRGKNLGILPKNSKGNRAGNEMYH